MAFQAAKEFLEKRGFGDRIKEFDVSSATVELAAVAVGCEPAHIAKTLSFLTGEGPGPYRGSRRCEDRQSQI